MMRWGAAGGELQQSLLGRVCIGLSLPPPAGHALIVGVAACETPGAHIRREGTGRVHTAALTPAPCALPLQGLSDGPYYLVMWAWHLLLYCAFVTVFCIFGGLIGLKVQTALQPTAHSMCMLALQTGRWLWHGWCSDARLPAVAGLQQC